MNSVLCKVLRTNKLDLPETGTSSRINKHVNLNTIEDSEPPLFSENNRGQRESDWKDSDIEREMNVEYARELNVKRSPMVLLRKWYLRMKESI